MRAKLSHDRAFELLPWLVNGTLQRGEREQLERHVRDCLVCRKELSSQQALAAAIHDQPTLDWSAQQGFNALLDRIDMAEERTSTSHARWRMSVASPLLWTSVSAAAVVLLVVAVWTVRPSNELSDSAAFSTLTQPSSGTLVDVIFSPGTSETQMRTLLQELGATIVAGPSELGRYTIRAGATEPGEIDALIARLREDSRVRFAGPSFAADAPGAQQ